ncbi:PREDICTED: tetratricopeptide repeat protein 16-like isoform X2 [Priapulus caudatus]|uniref:Tetratricopeptide repeat protein 16-like isoform X2 n=1 Tax=Priapulus caudatus TaxID=37621 RepID=A0ABM1EEJ5_PRICU|nr:PREDICTED: tetratricopeptide repeat protein 16-like isoform X2 [Priapulus caudatus]
MADYQQAFELDPTDPSIHVRLAAVHAQVGRSCHEQHQYQTAVHHLSEAVHYNPRDADVYATRATCRLKLQELVGAREDVVAAALLGPSTDLPAALCEQLFPGKDLRQVLQSPIAEEMQCRLLPQAVTSASGFKKM